MAGIDRRKWICEASKATAWLAARGFVLTQDKFSISLPPIRSTFNGVIVGCNTYSMKRLSLEGVVRAMANADIGLVEIHPYHIEPSFKGNAGDSVLFSLPRKSATLGRREKLRQWRLTVPLEEIQAAGNRFMKAGIYVYAYNMNFPADDFTEAEIERSFEMTKALGAQIMVPAVGSSATIPRLDPFAKKYRIRYGIHNEDSIRTPRDLDQVRKGLSDYAAIALDIGHFVANGADPVDYLAKHQEDIIALHIKDRKRNNGAIVPFGKGDTPIKEVLGLLRERKYKVPATIEYENRNAAPEASVRAAFEYCRQALL